MTPPDSRARLGIGMALALLVAITHGQHDLTPLHLPPATWAAFFLGGFYLRHARWWLMGLGLVAGLDLVAVTWGGVSDFCLSPAYLFMVPAYGVLWWSGRTAAGHLSGSLRDVVILGACLSGIVISELLASGSFYLFSGRVLQPGLQGMATYLVTWAPQTLEAYAFWIGVAIPAHVLFQILGETHRWKVQANPVARKGVL